MAAHPVVCPAGCRGRAANDARGAQPPGRILRRPRMARFIRRRRIIHRPLTLLCVPQGGAEGARRMMRAAHSILAAYFAGRNAPERWLAPLSLSLRSVRHAGVLYESLNQSRVVYPFEVLGLELFDILTEC